MVSGLQVKDPVWHFPISYLSRLSNLPGFHQNMNKETQIWKLRRPDVTQFNLNLQKTQNAPEYERK